ncbi:hypothetical protein VOLCADRAFT_99481 [Volvox carteri f. nagariensis]|uniref:FAD synthase n=1 Tax=Volvox carteri f. nagariensis TaxID=3068 RepID=D8UHW9_VOLCA|nr:uncharacterized protein VOLCADRAFT_99481 [Volvox carteri f. nagariensis]EFJ40692.1 hypothetical protein VOLCADRAFT_99481 [Volvox carteri f. nagariensis]|eukprot:XP_002958238.1 hypothetical protein VOLCADRAFT_99481 [Volvox carteri f. nagariensis]
MDILQQIDSIPDPVVADKACKAVQVLRRTCALYPLDKIAFSFNGGKDSTVLLHLLRAAVAQLENCTDLGGLGGIKSFYFCNDDDFPEVKDFVQRTDAECVQSVGYGLCVEYLRLSDFKRGLCEYLDRTGVMAIVLGTRRGDPNGGNQDCFCPSSDGWPPFMRVNPIIDWTYHDVWVFLRATHVPYCSLYDHGYTSLGGTGNTLPNSALRSSDGSYEPAYKLADGRLERVGRVHPATHKQAATRHSHLHPRTPLASSKCPGAVPGQEDSTHPQKAQIEGQQQTDGLGEEGTEEEGDARRGGGGAGGDGAAREAGSSLATSGGGGAAGGGGGGGGGLTHSAAIVIIGDELLSGKVEDVNARFLCRELRSLGWQVTRVVFVPDDVDEIASAVRALAAVVQLVITAGGIGPTLDDVTMQASRCGVRGQGGEQRNVLVSLSLPLAALLTAPAPPSLHSLVGIARAVGQPLVRLPALVERLSSYFGGPAALSEAHLKMAEAPQHTELIDYTLPYSDHVSKFPLMRVNNIYVLPGVPSLLVQKWNALKPRLQEAALAPFRNATLRLSVKDETTIAPALVRVASSHGLDVAVGSYPVDQGIIITLDSKNSEKLEAAIAEIQQLLPGEAVVALERDVDSLA